MTTHTLAAMLLCVALTAGAAPGAVYHVDFRCGADTHDGLSAATAFKHAPGYPPAADKARAVKLAPGDTVLLKGGVVYRGQVDIRASGAEGRPIVYDGNTAGAFGQGRAIIDGSEPLAGWTRCTSEADCGGNPNWQHIWYADVPAKLTPFTVNLTQGDTSLPVAQDPNPADPFFEDVIDTWQPIAKPLPAAYTPVAITAAKGMAENSTRPYILTIDGSQRSSCVLDPCKGAELTYRLPKAVTVTAFGLAVSTTRYYQVPKDVVLVADGKEVLRAALEAKGGVQTFKLDKPVTFRDLTLKVLTIHESSKGYGALYEVQALDADGRNLLAHPPVMVYRDPAYFTQSDPHVWDDAWFVIYARTNVVYYQKVLAFDPETDTVRFQMLTARQYDDRGRFSMMNALAILDRPGEFVLREVPGDDGAAKRVYVWPLGGEKGLADIACARRSAGFRVSHAGHVVIRGFLIQKQGASGTAGAITGGGKGADHVLIEGNEVRLVRNARNKVISLSDVAHCTIRKNHVHHNRRAGAIHLTRSSDCAITDNRLHKNGATALSLYTCERVEISRNVLTDHKGMHANGLTAYLDCKRIQFLDNRVSGGNVGLTVQQGEDMLIQGNIIDGGGTQMCVGVWNTDNLKNVRFYNNCFIRASRDVGWAAGIYFGGRNRSAVGYVMKNNVLDGTSAGRNVIPIERSHNVYTRRRWCEQDEQGWKPGEGETVEPDLSKLFVDPDGGDWRPAPNGPLVDAGTGVGVTEDIVGTPVPQGKAPDVGAYEHKGE